MKDEDKSKEELLSELTKLRQQLVELERSEAERQRAEKALRYSRQLLDKTFAGLLDAIFIVDADTTEIIDCNPAATETFGYTRQEMLVRKTDFLHVDEASLEQFRADLYPAVEEKGFLVLPEFRMKRKNGEVFFTEHSVVPLEDEKGKRIGWVSVVRDITDRKWAEEALRESEERHRRITEATTDYIFTVRVENGPPVETFHGPACEAVTGYTSEEFSSDPTLWIRMVPEEDRDIVREQASRILSGHNPQPIEHRIVRKDGRVHWVNNTPVPHYDNEGNLISYDGLIRDITERKQAEEALQKAHDELERRVEERTAELLRTNEKLEQEIEERKEAEKALRESEEKYRELFENESDAVMIFDAETLQFEDANPATLDLYGYSKEEFLTLTVEDISAEEEKTRIAVQRVKNGAPGSKRVLLRYFRKKDGAIFPGEICAGTFISGGRKKIIGAVRDITERKRAEDARQESEATLKAILAASPVGIGLARNRILDWTNKAMYRIWGYEEGSLLGKSTEILYPDAEEYERVGRKFYSDIEERGVGQVESRWVTKDGREIHCYLQGCSLDPSDLSKGVIVAAMDITERKRAEEVLQESERRYRLLAENVTDVIWTMDMNLRMTYESPSVTQLRGYTVEEAMAQTLEEVLTPASLEVARKALAEELARDDSEQKVPSKPRTLELELRCKDGSTVWTEVKASLLRDPEGKSIGILGVTRDISERKQAEEKLRNYQNRLRSLASELSLTEQRERQALATDLHDSIGQILAVSKLKLDALQNVVPSPPLAGDLDEVRKLIGQALQQTRSLTFQLSPPVLHQFGLEAAVEYQTEEMAKLHGLAIEFVDDKRTKPLSEDIRVLLFRAVQELLVNVVKHAKAQNVRVSVCRDGENLRIEVEDDGIGFEVSGSAIYPQETGKFGLFSIKERSRHFGGDFEIFSNPGEGTRVILVAPLQS
jgi:PAS domain S-box-containing protein